MKILSNQQIRDTDAYTIQNEPIASIDLMERASKAFLRLFVSLYSNDFLIRVFCGSGNNGGDGLAIARLLIGLEYKVEVWCISGDQKSEDFIINYDRLKSLVDINSLAESTQIPEFEPGSVIIDALFGSGLSRPLHGIFADVVDAINHSKSDVIAVDIPSGLYSDQPSVQGSIINADHTISFQLPKLAFMMPGNGVFVGNWHVVDIGLNNSFIESVQSENYFLEKNQIGKIVQKRNKFAHKGDFGRAKLISGSYGKMGATILAARAALRSGIGLLTAYIPQCGYTILQAAVPELMVETDDDDEFIAYSPNLDTIDTLGIGPGLGTHKLTAQALGEILRTFNKPVVLDADALNIIGEHREFLSLIPEGSILTPHLKEFERLTLTAENDYHRLELLSSLCRDHKIYIILKGAHSVLSDPSGKLYFNSTGNPGMATAGSGDVLTGILTAFLARYNSEDAAKLGMYIHGLAGDIAAEQKGMDALIAGDIIEALPLAFQQLTND